MNAQKENALSLEKGKQKTTIKCHHFRQQSNQLQKKCSQLINQENSCYSKTPNSNRQQLFKDKYSFVSIKTNPDQEIEKRQNERSKFIPNIKNYRNERNLSKLRKIKATSKFAELKQNPLSMIINDKKQNDFLSDYEDKIDELFNVETQQQAQNMTTQNKSNQSKRFIRTKFEEQKIRKQSENLTQLRQESEFNLNTGISHLTAQNKQNQQKNFKFEEQKNRKQSENLTQLKQESQLNLKLSGEQTCPGIPHFFSPQAQQYQLKNQKGKQFSKLESKTYKNSAEKPATNKSIYKILQQQTEKAVQQPYFK